MLRLLNLPADLRLMIWELVIPQDEVVSLGLGKPTRSCDRLAAPKECSLQFYKEGISGPSDYFEVTEVFDFRDLMLLDQQTSEEVRWLFWSNNEIEFNVDVWPGEANMQDAIEWTIPDAMVKYARHLAIKLPSLCNLDEADIRIAKKSLAFLTEQLFGDPDRGRSIPAQPFGFILKPLVALAAQRVNNLEFRTWFDEGNEAVVLHNFCKKMARVLEADVSLRERKDGRWDHDSYLYEVQVEARSSDPEAMNKQDSGSENDEEEMINKRYNVWDKIYARRRGLDHGSETFDEERSVGSAEGDLASLGD